MSTNPRPRRSRSEWERVFSEFKLSELSRSAFCKQRAINLTTFLRWHRKIVETPRDFIDVTPPRVSTSQVAVWSVELELPNGIMLRLA